MDNKWSTSDSTSMASSTFPQTAKLRQFGRTTALDSINSNGQEHTATGGRQPSTDVTSGSLTSMASPNIPTSAHRVQVTFSESRKRWRRPVCSPCQSRSRETGRKPCSRRVTGRCNNCADLGWSEEACFSTRDWFPKNRTQFEAEMRNAAAGGDESASRPSLAKDQHLARKQAASDATHANSSPYPQALRTLGRHDATAAVSSSKPQQELLGGVATASGPPEPRDESWRATGRTWVPMGSGTISGTMSDSPQPGQPMLFWPSIPDKESRVCSPCLSRPRARIGAGRNIICDKSVTEKCNVCDAEGYSWEACHSTMRNFLDNFTQFEAERQATRSTKAAATKESDIAQPDSQAYNGSSSGNLTGHTEEEQTLRGPRSQAAADETESRSPADFAATKQGQNRDLSDPIGGGPGTTRDEMEDWWKFIVYDESSGNEGGSDF